MRTLILAVLLGLFSILPAAFAAPSSNCSVTVKNGEPVLKGCSAKQRKQFKAALDAASSKPTTKALSKVLRKRMGKFYLTIRTVCFPGQEATRRPLSSRAIERCVNRLDYSPKAVVLQAENNVKAIKKCIGIKSYKRQLMCMINAKNSGELQDIILAALDLRDAHWKGLRDLNKFGCKLKRGKLQCAGFNHPIGILLILLTLLWGRGLCNFMVASVENEGSYHNRYLEKDYICPFGRMWAACRIMIVALVAVVLLLATTTNLYAACTDAEVASNEVAAQYGMVFYDCIPQASKDAVFEVIWRGYVAKGGLKLGMSKQYIRSRWERAEGAFWNVWKDAPLWQAKLAAAICAKETLCGVVVKFSEWETHRFQSPKNNNGTIDCGVTQINSSSTSYSCDELQNLETAFREQRRIIMLKVGGSNRKSVWKARIHRYNGSGMKARQYGQLIMSWAK